MENEILKTANKILEIANEQDPDDMKWNALQGYAASLVRQLTDYKAKAEELTEEIQNNVKGLKL